MTAETLHVREAPAIIVRSTGDEHATSHSGSTRANLPPEVDQGSTYRRCRIDYGLTSRINPDEVLRDLDTLR